MITELFYSHILNTEQRSRIRDVLGVYLSLLLRARKVLGLSRNGVSGPPVVRKVDNAIHRINHYPADNTFFLSTFICWIAIHAVSIF